MIEAFLWDCDGVLVTTVDLHARAFAEAVREVSGSILTPDIEAQLNGLSTREKLRRLVDEGAVCRRHVEEVWARKQDLTVSRIQECITPDREKLRMFDDLFDLHGFKRHACVSNSIRLTTNAMLRAANLFHFMELILSNEDVPRQKPDPAPYLTAFERLNLRPDQCVIVEDSPHGQQSARESGGHVLAVDSYKDVTLETVLHFLASIGH